MPEWAPTQCARCGAQIEQRTKGRPRRWCSQACRMAAYRAACVTKVNRTAQDDSGHIIYQADAAAPRLATAAPATEASDGH